MNKNIEEYAQALIEVAAENKQLDLYFKLIEKLEILFVPEYIEILNSYFVSLPKKLEILEKSLKKRIPIEMFYFFVILIKKHLFHQIHAIFKQFTFIYYEQKNITIGEVITIKPLSEQRLKQIELATSKKFKHKVYLRNIVDPTIIGGIKIYIKGITLDYTVKQKLIDLAKKIEKAEV